MSQDMPDELRKLLSRRMLWADDVRRVKLLAHRHGIEVVFTSAPLAGWAAPEVALTDRRCWAFLGRDQRDEASLAARHAGRCVVCGAATNGSGAATCRSVPCLTKWLLPAKAREEAARLAMQEEESEED